jgi:hypothetical protein
MKDLFKQYVEDAFLPVFAPDRQPTFDSGCYELAKSFLEDSKADASKESVTKLAGLIQQTIEDYIESEEAKRA